MDSFSLKLSNERVVMALRGNIVTQQVDAIVNAANSSLLGGGGVDGAIHAAGGPEILEDCRRIVTQIGKLPTGQAVATTGGRLKARYVIHTVGPIWSGGYSGEPDQLASCYRESLSRADELHLRSVSFPAISTGVYGYPMQEGAEVAVATVIEAIQMTAYVREVRFVLFKTDAYDAFVSELKKFSYLSQDSSAEQSPTAASDKDANKQS